MLIVLTIRRVTILKSVTQENTKSANLTELLIEQIVRGQLAAGSKISEPELARQFAVSRGPLREAIMRVESMGLVERIPHVGARVIALDLQQLVDIYAVREALEGMAVRLACQHISDAQLVALEQLLNRHYHYIEQVEGQAYFDQVDDYDFHYQLILASQNQKLTTLLCGELYHLLRMYRYRSQRSTARPKQAWQEHKQILEAVKDRDGELAELLMRRHIQRSRTLIERQLKEQES